MSWPSPTASCSEVSGWKGSAGLVFRASASGMVLARLRRAAGKIAIDEAVAALRRLELRLLEDRLMQRRQRAGRIGIAGIAGQREGLAAAPAKIDLTELAGFARLLHPGSAAISVEGLGVLPDPGDRMVGSHGFELQSGDAFGRMAGQYLARGRNVEELPPPAAHAFLRPQRIVIGNDIVDGQNAFQPRLRVL